MATLELKKDILLKTRDRCSLSAEDRAMVERVVERITPSTHTLDVRLEDFPVGYWQSMLDDSRLTGNQRAQIARHVFGMTARPRGAQEIYATEVTTPVDFGSTFGLLGVCSPNCELFLNGRWYPVIVNCQFLEDEGKIARDVLLSITLSFCELSVQRTYLVYRDLFLDHQGNRISRTVLDVLRTFGLRELRTSMGEHNLRLLKAERQSRETGRVLLVSGPMIVNSQWNGFDTRSHASGAAPTKAIVEPELEVYEDQRAYFVHQRGQQQGLSRLPFVRLFCLEIKRYVYVDIDDVTPYEFDTAALERLCLPEQMLSVLTRVFETPVDRMFGDLIRGKHGGVVVLASGKPGVGKTLTAEIYAERTERPLYVLEMGELGTSAEQIEERLRHVFARVTRWNAVLQFDECEIFLAKRNDDLERSAIVGIFLRLLDYYQGMLFLTSNRPEVLDEAVHSRVMLRLTYPDLTPASRREIWRNMTRAAHLEFASVAVLQEVASWELNGRQIRNFTRLARILFPEGALTLERMQEVLRFGAGPASTSPT